MFGLDAKQAQTQMRKTCNAHGGSRARAHTKPPGEAPKQAQSAASNGTTNGTAVGRAVRQRTYHTTRTAKTDQVRSGQKLSLPNIQNVEQKP